MIGADSQEIVGEIDNKVYDDIVSKIIEDPRIDKKTLIQKFIAKMEMESNISVQMTSELSQIKQIVADDSES